MTHLRTTPEQIAEWKQIAEAATAGPWAWQWRAGDDLSPGSIYADDWQFGLRAVAMCPRYGKDYFAANAAFIAAARTAVPALLADVETLEAEVGALKVELEGYGGYGSDCYSEGYERGEEMAIEDSRAQLATAEAKVAVLEAEVAQFRQLAAQRGGRAKHAEHQLATARADAMEVAAVIAERDDLKPPGTSPWDEGMRDMSVRIAAAIRSASQDTGGTR